MRGLGVTEMFFFGSVCSQMLTRYLSLCYYLTVSDKGEIIKSNPPLTTLRSPA